MFYHVSVLVVLYAVQATARLVRRDQVYSTSAKDSSLAASFGAVGQLTTVNAGVSRWLSGGVTHNFLGNINNYGSITASQTDYLKIIPLAVGLISTYVGHDPTNGNLNNYGAISLNDFGASSGAAYQWNIRNMENAGSMQWCGRGDLLGSTYQLYCDNTCYNDGVIDWEQYNGNVGIAFTWRNTALVDVNSVIQATSTQSAGAQATAVLANIYNNGAFRLINVDFQGVQNVLGTGCWVLGAGSTLYLQDGAGVFQNPSLGPTYPDQMIYFASSTATLHMDTLVYGLNSNFGPQLYGFASGNAIEFLEIISTFTYNTATGILTVNMISGTQALIKLGVGYTASSFTVGNHVSKYNLLGFNAILYSGAAPSQIVPTKCLVSLAVCTDPAATATSVALFKTITIAYTGAQTLSGPLTQTLTQASGTVIGTVAVYTPAGTYTTITQLYTPAGTAIGPSTSTIARATGTTPGTIVVYTPGSYVTATLLYTGSNTLSGPVTSTVALPSGSNPGTVAVYTPGVYTTTTQVYGGAAPSTSTIAPPVGTAPGTVVVYTPGVYVTTTQVYTGASPLTGPSTTTVAQPTGTVPGTVAVFTAAAPTYLTTTVAFTGLTALTGPLTSTIVPQVGTTPGIIAILTPVVTATASTTSSSTRPASLPTILGSNQCLCVPV